MTDERYSVVRHRRDARQGPGQLGPDPGALRRRGLRRERLDRRPGRHRDRRPQRGGQRAQELYFVVSGRATFTVDGEEVDAPAGTFVFPTIRRCSERRSPRSPARRCWRSARRRGEAYRSLGWEWTSEAFPLFGEERYQEANELLAEAEREHPDSRACSTTSRARRLVSARRTRRPHTWHRAVELRPRIHEDRARRPGLRLDPRPPEPVDRVSVHLTTLDELDSIPVGDHGLHVAPGAAPARHRGLRRQRLDGGGGGAGGRRAARRDRHGRRQARGALHRRARPRPLPARRRGVRRPGGHVRLRAATARARGAYAEEPGTTVLAMGAKPGEAYEVSPWESYFAAIPLFAAGDYDGAAALMRRRARAQPGQPVRALQPRLCRGLGGHARRRSSTSRVRSSWTRRRAEWARERQGLRPRSATTRASRQLSPGRRTPPARARSAGTGSASGRATRSTAPSSSPASASTSSCSPTRERERLVRLLAAEGHELLGRRRAGEHVAVGHRAHRDVGDERARRRSSGCRSRAGSCPRAAGRRPGAAAARGEVAVRTPTSPPSARRRTQ